MSNNPVSFVDPDGGQDLLSTGWYAAGWADRSHIDYYVDGIKSSRYDYLAAIDGSKYYNQSTDEVERGFAITLSGSAFSGLLDKEIVWNITKGLTYAIQGGVFVFGGPEGDNTDLRGAGLAVATRMHVTGSIGTIRYGELFGSKAKQVQDFVVNEVKFYAGANVGGAKAVYKMLEGTVVAAWKYNHIVDWDGSARRELASTLARKETWINIWHTFQQDWGRMQTGSAYEQGELVGEYGTEIASIVVPGAQAAKASWAARVARRTGQLAEAGGWMGGSTVLGVDEATAINASRMVPEKGVHQVLLHGTADGFLVDGVFLTPKELARTMLQSGFQRGTRVRLISCTTGVFPDGAAYQLSRYLRSPVMAPTTRVKVLEGGSYAFPKGEGGRFRTFFNTTIE